MPEVFIRSRDRRVRIAGLQKPGRPRAGVGPDEDVVAAAVAGRRMTLRPANLAAAIAAMEKCGGWSAEQIARHLGCSYRTVQRHRAARRARGEVA